MSADDCVQINSCEMYKLLRFAGTLKAWQSRYCCADYKSCARYRLATEGRPVPINLMPSGSLLRTWDSKDSK